MYLSEDYFVFELHQRGEQRLLRELERRRVIDERLAEQASAADGVTDAARPRRGIRALLPRRLRPLQPPRPVML
jgi:hypothetical protein